MSYIHSLLSSMYRFFTPIFQMGYRYPLLMGVILTIFSSCYLIVDYGVVNSSSLQILWQLQHNDGLPETALGQIIWTIAKVFSLDYVFVGYLLMVMCHTFITVFLLLIAKLLYFSKLTRWALLFLLLCHPSYCDFRAYIIIEPVFWALWLGAVYAVLRYHKENTLLAIGIWFTILLICTHLTVSAWFWLLFFPFGALFWKPWRRRSVTYALLGYAIIVTVLLFLPIYGGQSPLQWFVETVINNPNVIIDVLGINQSNWVKEEDTLVASIFIITGATSLVIIRGAIVFGIISVVLAVYAVLKKQYRIANTEYMRILLYIVAFGTAITVIAFILDRDSGSLIPFSISLLLFLLAALGLSYVFRKIAHNRYSRLSTLVIIWVLVGYFASGFIIFGPKKDYLREAGEFTQKQKYYPVYSNHSTVQFYLGNDPSKPSELEDIVPLIGYNDFYYAYAKHRHSDIPQELGIYTPIHSFRNPRGDKVLIYHFVTTSDEIEYERIR